MPWIESHSELRNHPKAKRMKRKLRLSEHETVGLLHYFWYWALEFAQDGVLTGMSAEDIADGCRFDGDPDELIEALIHAGFVDEVDGERTIHDWFKHGGKLVIWRQKEAARSKANRGKNKENPVNTESVQRTEDVRTADEQGYVPTSNSYSNKKIKPIADSDECGEMFEQFWRMYPSKKGRASAIKKWQSLWKKGISMDEVLEGTKRYIEFCQATDRPYKDGSTFVNQEGWKDDWAVTVKKTFVKPEKTVIQHELVIADDEWERNYQANLEKARKRNGVV